MDSFEFKKELMMELFLTNTQLHKMLTGELESDYLLFNVNYFVLFSWLIRMTTFVKKNVYSHFHWNYNGAPVHILYVDLYSSYYFESFEIFCEQVSTSVETQVLQNVSYITHSLYIYILSTVCFVRPMSFSLQSKKLH